VKRFDRQLSTRWIRSRLPARTIRLRLTALYGTLFLVSGAALLTITYALAAHHYSSGFFIANGKKGVIAARVTVNSKSARVLPGKLYDTAVSLPLLPIGAKANPKQVLAAASAQASAADSQLLADSAVALAAMAVLSIWLGWVIAGRALRPLRAMADAAHDISATNLNRRLALTGPDDEITQLGNSFDELLERLEAAFDAQRRFVANASHELRTPLTYERTLLEVALADPDANEDTLRAACNQALAVGKKQEQLIEALLTLSRSQRGLEERHDVDLASITRDALRTVTQDGVMLETNLAKAPTNGDPRLIERLVANLLDNALHYNVPHGRVSVSTRRIDGSAVLTVTNTGPVIPEDEIDRLFQPFQRLDRERTSQGGVGLGLSIVQAIAQAHDASLSVRPEPGGGLHVEVAFPTAGRSS
jgi:signal transduction histidine kinase